MSGSALWGTLSCEMRGGEELLHTPDDTCADTALLADQSDGLRCIPAREMGTICVISVFVEVMISDGLCVHGQACTLTHLPCVCPTELAVCSKSSKYCCYL